MFLATTKTQKYSHLDMHGMRYRQYEPYQEQLCNNYDKYFPVTTMSKMCKHLSVKSNKFDMKNQKI